jgi:signal transduction histidine kinase
LEITESVVDELREIGHGLLTPDLAAQDLSVALASVRWPDSGRLRIIANVDPAPSRSARQAIIDIASELATWTRQHESRVETVVVERSGDSIAFAMILASAANVAATSQLRSLLNDFAGAAGGQVRVAHTAASLEVTGSVPEHLDGATPPLTMFRRDAHAEALGPYLRGSLLLSAVGVTLVVLLSPDHWSWGLAALGGLMVLTMVLLGLAYQRLQQGETLQTIAITTAASTLIPCGVILLLPKMSSALVIFTVLPLMVAPSITGPGQFVVICILQQVAAVFILAVAVLESSTPLGAGLPDWLIGGALFVIPTAVAFLLLRVDRTTKTALQRDIALLRASRAEIVTASRTHRRELERDLHDGAQQVVVALAAQLRVFLRRLGQNPSTAQAMMPQLLRATVDADTALADFSAGNYPSLLIERGLAGGLRQLAALCPHRTIVDLDLPRELPADVELTVYYCCSEAMQNAAKHAGAGTSVHVMVHDRGDAVHFEIIDDGRGYDRNGLSADGRGVANIETRVKRLLGDVEVESAIGRGCAVRAWLPVDPIPAPA